MSTPDISHYDFTDYEEPLLQSLHAWEQASDEWSSRVRLLLNVATKQRRIEPTAQQLVQATEHYADAFEAAAMAVAVDSLIEETAVRSLTRLVRADDTRRRRQLRKGSSMLSIPAVTHEHISELAHAYGDPSGKLLALGTNHHFEPSTMARLSFLAALEDQAGSVLGSIHHLQPQSRHTPESYPHKPAGKAFGPYQPRG